MIDFDSLETQALEQQNDSAFKHLSRRFVPGEGDNPKAFIVGEAPGAQEEMQGRPFVGPAGVMLRRLMALASLDTEDQYDDGRDSPPTAGANCWLTNSVKFRPPRNRTPTPQEIDAAKLYLMREWAAVGSPLIIIPVGSVALRAILGKNISILKVAGQQILKTSQITGQLMHVCPMIHTSFGLRNPDVQPIMESHWLKLAESMEVNATY